MKLLNELENRNNYLEQLSVGLKEERKKCSRRASDIQFILIGIKGEMEANRQIMEKIRNQEEND
jgi:hypothetical protein